MRDYDNKGVNESHRLDNQADAEAEYREDIKYEYKQRLERTGCNDPDTAEELLLDMIHEANPFSLRYDILCDMLESHMGIPYEE